MTKGEKRVGPLKTPLDCRRELARVYREARRGAIGTQDASRFANILHILLSMIRDSDLEERMAQLERLLEGEE